MKLKQLTYTSLARFDLSSADLRDILVRARDLNALDGITGLLIFNGTNFLQIIEGAEDAIDNLLDRLRLDPRHSAVEVRDVHIIDERAFPDWSMELVCVSASEFEARETIAEHLPPTIPADVRKRILDMAECLSGVVVIPD